MEMGGGGLEARQSREGLANNNRHTHGRGGKPAARFFLTSQLFPGVPAGGGLLSAHGSRHHGGPTYVRSSTRNNLKSQSSPASFFDGAYGVFLLPTNEVVIKQGPRPTGTGGNRGRASQQGQKRPKGPVELAQLVMPASRGMPCLAGQVALERRLV